jgi:hypothetical protein
MVCVSIASSWILAIDLRIYLFLRSIFYNARRMSKVLQRFSFLGYGRFEIAKVVYA